MIFYNSENKVLFFPSQFQSPLLHILEIKRDSSYSLLHPTPTPHKPQRIFQGVISTKVFLACPWSYLSVCSFLPPTFSPSLPSFLSSFSLFQLAPRTSRTIQWLRLQIPNAGYTGLIPAWGTKILHPAWRSQKSKNKANMAPVKPAHSLLFLLPKDPQTQFCSSLRPRPQSYQVLPGCSVCNPVDRPQLAQCLPRWHGWCKGKEDQVLISGSECITGKTGKTQKDFRKQWQMHFM